MTVTTCAAPVRLAAGSALVLAVLVGGATPGSASSAAPCPEMTCTDDPGPSPGSEATTPDPVEPSPVEPSPVEPSPVEPPPDDPSPRPEPEPEPAPAPPPQASSEPAGPGPDAGGAAAASTATGSQDVRGQGTGAAGPISRPGVVGRPVPRSRALSAPAQDRAGPSNREAVTGAAETPPAGGPGQPAPPAGTSGPSGSARSSVPPTQGVSYAVRDGGDLPGSGIGRLALMTLGLGALAFGTARFLAR